MFILCVSTQASPQTSYYGGPFHRLQQLHSKACHISRFIILLNGTPRAEHKKKKTNRVNKYLPNWNYIKKRPLSLHFLFTFCVLNCKWAATNVCFEIYAIFINKTHFDIKCTEISVVKITVNKQTHLQLTLARTPYNFLRNCTLSSY